MNDPYVNPEPTVTVEAATHHTLSRATDMGVCPVCGERGPLGAKCPDGCGGVLVSAEDARAVGGALDTLLSGDVPAGPAADLERIRTLAKTARSQAAAPDYDEEAIAGALWAVVDAALAAASSPGPEGEGDHA